MPAVKLSPLFNNQTASASGPASGYKVHTYAAGSSTALATYTTSAGTVAQTNPVILDAHGYPATGPIWLQSGLAYKLVLTDPDDNVIKTFDGISGVNDASISTSQWQNSGVTPTYISAASFSVPGDQTSEFHSRRRVQLLVAAGTVYGTISTSTYSTLTTTVEVNLDSGALDAGLTVVNLSILRADYLPFSIADQESVKGLVGNVNAATPLTKFDLSAGMVTLRSATQGSATRRNTGTLTCDLGLTGPVANGRDRAGAFTASSWVNLFFIWNGATLATIASTAAATAGPTLPSGYTHWAYATTIRWAGGSTIFPVLVRGARVFYDSATTAGVQLLAAGQATDWATLTCSNFYPPNTVRAEINVKLGLEHSITSGWDLYLRTTGSVGAGFGVASGTTSSAGMAFVSQVNSVDVVLDALQRVDYMLNAVPNVSGGAYLYAKSYAVANGDV